MRERVKVGTFWRGPMGEVMAVGWARGDQVGLYLLADAPHQVVDAVDVTTFLAPEELAPTPADEPEQLPDDDYDQQGELLADRGDGVMEPAARRRRR